MSQEIPINLRETSPLVQASLGPFLFMLLFYFLDLPFGEMVNVPGVPPWFLIIFLGTTAGALPGYMIYRKCRSHNKYVREIQMMYRNQNDLSPQIELKRLTEIMESLIVDQPTMYWIGMLGSGFLVLVAVIVGIYSFAHGVLLLASGSITIEWYKPFLTLLVVFGIGYFGCSLAGIISNEARQNRPIRISVQHLQELIENQNFEQAEKSLSFLEKERTNRLFQHLAGRARSICYELQDQSAK